MRKNIVFIFAMSFVSFFLPSILLNQTMFVGQVLGQQVSLAPDEREVDVRTLRQQVERLTQEIQGLTDIEANKKIEMLESKINDMQTQIDKNNDLYIREEEFYKTVRKEGGLLNVSAPGLKSLKIGGSTRARFEANSNFDFDDSNGDGKEFTLLQTKLNLDAEVNEHIRSFLEIQDNRLFGEAADAPDGSEFANGLPLTLAGTNGGTIGNLNRLDLLQGYADISLFERIQDNSDQTNLTFRIGRWQMNYGGQKIISPLPWLNQGRAWDGLRLRYEKDEFRWPFWVDVFATQLDEDFIDPGRGGEDEDKIFTGVYGHLAWQKGHEIEPYFLYRKSSGETAKPDGVLAATGRTNEERTTAGVRVYGELASLSGLEYTGEFVAQFGSINGHDSTSLDIEDAFGAYTEVAYTWKDIGWKPKIGYAFHFASGDDDPNDDEAGTFDQIYPLSHAYLGYIDFQAWQNIIGHQFSVSSTPLKNLLAKIDFHLFELEEDNDAWYGASGAPNEGFSSAAVNAADADDEIGQEIDVTMQYKLFERFDVTLGYSRFFAGDMIKDVAATDDDADWFYLMTYFKF